MYYQPINVDNLEVIQKEVLDYILSNISSEEAQKNAVIPILLYKNLLSNCPEFLNWATENSYIINSMGLLILKNNNVSIHLIEGKVFYVPLVDCKDGQHEFFEPCGEANYGIQDNGIVYIYYNEDNCILKDSISVNVPILREKNVLCRQRSSANGSTYVLIFSVKE